MLQRWGRWVARRYRWIFAAWVVLLGGVWALAGWVGGEASNDFTLPGSSAQDALDLLEEDFPAAAGTSATVVYHATGGADLTTDTTLQATIESSVTDLGVLDGVASVVDPFANDDALVSDDGTTALANVVYSQPFEDLPDNGVEAYEALDDSVLQYRSADLRIELGGSLPGAQPIDVEGVLVLYG